MEISERYRARRRKTLFYRVLFVLVFFLFLGALVGGSFWIPFFRIKSIETKGIIESEKTNKVVLAYLNGLNKFFVPKNNFFIVDTNAISQFLKENNFGVAVVTKRFPHSIEISFPERETHFIICASNDVCYYVNADGLVYSESPQFSDYPLPLIVIKQTPATLQDNPSITLGDYLTNQSNMQYLNTWTRGLSKLDIKTKIIEIVIHNQTHAPFNFKEIKIFTSKEWYIYLNTETAPKNALDNIKLLFEQKIKNDTDKLQYIDLRFENKAFYMLY